MISRIFIERPKLAFVISIVTVLAGAICIFRLPVAEYPEIAPPSIMVSASYPGASAEVIANTVATVVEEQVNGIEGMIYFSSTSSNAGSYSLTITFEPGTDTDIAQVNVQNAVRRAEPSLPSEVKALGININLVFTFVFALGGFLASSSGVLGGTYLAFAQGFDSTILTYSLVVVIIGGIGNLWGAALGALLVGLIDSITKATVTNLSMICIFGALMVVLAFRPNGLLGKAAKK